MKKMMPSMMLMEPLAMNLSCSEPRVFLWLSINTEPAAMNRAQPTRLKNKS